MEPNEQPQQEQTQPVPQNNSEAQKPYDIEPNIEAALSYFLTPFSGIAVFILEKENKFVRFHAFQSILFGVVAFGAWSIASALTAVLIGLILIPIVQIATLILWFFLMYKAYKNEEYHLPLLGDIAKQQVNK